MADLCAVWEQFRKVNTGKIRDNGWDYDGDTAISANMRGVSVMFNVVRGSHPMRISLTNARKDKLDALNALRRLKSSELLETDRQDITFWEGRLKDLNVKIARLEQMINEMESGVVHLPPT